MKIQNVSDVAFKKYGRVHKGYSLDDIQKAMQHTPVPADVVYVPSVEEMEELAEGERLKNQFFGGLPIQIGYCNGHNKKLNALEYHRCSEINIAVTDMILLLGQQQDIQGDDTYDTSLVEAFLVPANTMVELYATTLHYAPCHVDENGFRCVVVLPKDTNTELDVPAGNDGERKLLAAKNKWLIAHEDAAIPNAFCGLKGENITLD